uniref:Uncharacterized protein n=1 Tax=Glossina brevipalpis TaxID=37001 RepID=A0A1A9WCG7_9MUSC
MTSANNTPGAFKLPAVKEVMKPSTSKEAAKNIRTERLDMETHYKRKAERNNDGNKEMKRLALNDLTNLNIYPNIKTILPDIQKCTTNKVGTKPCDATQDNDNITSKVLKQNSQSTKIVVDTKLISPLVGTADSHANMPKKLQSPKQVFTLVVPEKKGEINLKKLPDDEEDFDKLKWNDPYQVSQYAKDIFNYLKDRESEYPIDNYMERQIHLTKDMRAVLVDWMASAQQTLELNHETLYLAVKIVDLYLCEVVITKNTLQLLGATALFLAHKYDDRSVPLIEDFLCLCSSYKYKELISMEILVFKAIRYDLGVPLSYRFLRRYARCGKVASATLTLARYILELSLMNYDNIAFSDSKSAAAALFIALRMLGVDKGWNATLEYYSDYKLKDFAEIVTVLNGNLHRKSTVECSSIRKKYSDETFFEVAMVPILTAEDLFKDNLDFTLHSVNSSTRNAS